LHKKGLIYIPVSNETTEKQLILCEWKMKINIWYLQFINIKEEVQVSQYVRICNLLLLVCSLISIFISLYTLLKKKFELRFFWIWEYNS